MPDVSTQDAKWSKACLRVFGDPLDPNEITRLLEIAPTNSGRKGEPSFTPLKRPCEKSIWIMDSPLAANLPLSDHLRWLLDVLEPKREIFHEIARKYEADLFCGFSSANGQGGFILEPALLSRLGNLGVELVLDLYPPGPVTPNLNQDLTNT